MDSRRLCLIPLFPLLCDTCIPFLTPEVPGATPGMLPDAVGCGCVVATLRGPRAGMGYGVGSELVTWLDYCVQRAAFFVCVNPSRVAAYWAYIQGEAHAVKLCRADVVYVHAVQLVSFDTGGFPVVTVADCDCYFFHDAAPKTPCASLGRPVPPGSVAADCCHGS